MINDISQYLSLCSILFGGIIFFSFFFALFLFSFHWFSYMITLGVLLAYCFVYLSDRLILEIVCLRGCKRRPSGGSSTSVISRDCSIYRQTNIRWFSFVPLFCTDTWKSILHSWSLWFSATDLVSNRELLIIELHIGWLIVIRSHH